MGRPFARAAAMFALVHAAVQLHGVGTVALADAINGMPQYRSRGKGKTARHNRGGVLTHRRAANKARNVARNRSAHRG